jgi:hypothetical protein
VIAVNDDPLEMSWNPSAFGGARAEPSQWRDSPQDHVALNEPLSSDLGDGAAASPATQAARVSLFAHLGEGDGEVGTLANDVDAGRGGGGGDGGGRSGRHGAARGAVSDEDLAIVADERAAEGPDLSAFKGTAPSAEDRAAIAGMMVGEDAPAQPSDAEVAKMADEMAAAGPDLSAFKGKPPSAADRAAAAMTMM